MRNLFPLSIFFHRYKSFCRLVHLSNVFKIGVTLHLAVAFNEKVTLENK